MLSWIIIGLSFALTCSVVMWHRESKKLAQLEKIAKAEEELSRMLSPATGDVYELKIRLDTVGLREQIVNIPRPVLAMLGDVVGNYNSWGHFRYADTFKGMEDE